MHFSSHQSQKDNRSWRKTYRKKKLQVKFPKFTRYNPVKITPHSQQRTRRCMLARVNRRTFHQSSPPNRSGSHIFTFGHEHEHEHLCEPRPSITQRRLARRMDGFLHPDLLLSSLQSSLTMIQWVLSYVRHSWDMGPDNADQASNVKSRKRVLAYFEFILVWLRFVH